MSKQTPIPVVIEEVKENNGNTQRIVQKVLINKTEYGKIIPEENGKFQLVRNEQPEGVFRNFDDALEWLIADYHLNS